MTNARDNSVSVIDTSTNSVITTIPVGFFPTDVAASPDGTIVYVPIFSENSIFAINTSTNMTQNVISTQGGSKPLGVAVAPNGLVYCANFSNASIFVIDPNSMTEVDNFALGAIFPFDLVISPDGTRAYVINSVAPKNVKVIDLATRLVIATVHTGQQTQGGAITPDGRLLYISNPVTNTVSVIDTTTNSVIANIALAANAFPRGIAVSPDGAFAYVVQQGSASVAVINTVSQAITATIALTPNSDPYYIAITPDGTQAYVTQTLTGNVSVINLATNLVTGTISVGNFPFSVAIANVP
ncbi:MAG: beta-propeller fold lactonase family protein [Verrucomicrobia bacterium]|nr:beta-propeller fold lactonase family protein [Verrucomicrobiota bacterium]